MSGCGNTWYTYGKKAICFEPETDKDHDRLRELLDDLREYGMGERIVKVEREWPGTSHWAILLNAPGANDSED